MGVFFYELMHFWKIVLNKLKPVITKYLSLDKKQKKMFASQSFDHIFVNYI